MFVITFAFSYVRFAILINIFTDAYLGTKSFVDAAPAKTHLPVPPAELFKFLRQFGYLDSSPSNSESLYAEEAIIESIKNLQKYGGLPETGELTNDTLQVR